MVKGHSGPFLVSSSLPTHPRRWWAGEPRVSSGGTRRGNEHGESWSPGGEIPREGCHPPTPLGLSIPRAKYGTRGREESPP